MYIKSLITILILACGLQVNAQKSKVVSAHNYLRYQELDKAMEAIDLASENAQTKGMAKTWFYRGKIYFAIYTSREDKDQGLHPQPLKEAVQSYQKALSLDTKKIDMTEFNTEYSRLAGFCFDKAVIEYNAKAFDYAVGYFEACVAVNKNYKIVDSLGIYNCGLAAEKNKDLKKARAYYSQCIDINYGGARLYANLSDTWKAEENDDEVLATLARGREKYPDDADLLTDEINLFLKLNRQDEAMANLDKAIAGDPENPGFLYARGTIHNKNGKIDLAEADYIKAIAQKPDFFDAQYNLGALYFNKAADYVNEIANIKDNAKYQIEKKKADAMFVTALPYLEKAHQLDGEDIATMQSLKQLYVRTGDNDKYTEMKDKLGN